jgi:hypothetical protein
MTLDNYWLICDTEHNVTLSPGICITMLGVLSVILPSVVMPNVILPNVVAPEIVLREGSARSLNLLSAAGPIS